MGFIENVFLNCSHGYGQPNSVRKLSGADIGSGTSLIVISAGMNTKVTGWAKI